MRLHSAILAVALALSPGLEGPVLAQESLDDIEGSPSKQAQDQAPAGGKAAGDAPSAGDQPAGSGGARAEVNGYFDNRLELRGISPSALVPTQDFPAISEIAEANLQLRVNLAGRDNFAYADLSLLYQSGWLFYEDDGSGGRRQVANHDVPALRPQVVPSELYVSLTPEPWLNVLVGKKRITWGSGVAFNPTDLINPPKDPTDPNFQRAGSWVVRVEAPLEKLTLTGLFAPQALSTQQGLPYAFLRYPTYAPADVRDNASHYLLALRLYALLSDTDVNLVYYFSNLYQDAFRRKSRFGLSLSRIVFDDIELHLEALLQQGSDRSFPNHGCLTGETAGETACDTTSALTHSKLDASTFYPRLLLGTRRQFSDESMLSVEYYFQADGYSDSEFQDRLQLSAYSKTSDASSSGALPQRVLFDPLRRHYLIASYSKPRIYDDWTASAVLIAGLRDLSGLFAPSIAWSPRDWLTLSLYGYIPIRGLGVNEAKVGNQRYSEYSLTQYDYRVLFEARLFY